MKPYRHYIRTNANGEIIAAFSSAFQEPLEGDILLGETDERHFNPKLLQEGVPRYTWDTKTKQMKERSSAELEALLAPAREKARVLSRLAELDGVVRRDVEQAYEDFGKTPGFAKIVEAIAEKKKLRARLAELGR